MTPRFLTAADVAAELQVSRRTAHGLMKQMTHVYAGRLLRVSRIAFDDWLAAQQREPIGVPFVGARFRTVPARMRAASTGVTREAVHITQPRIKRAKA